VHDRGRRERSQPALPNLLAGLRRRSRRSRHYSFPKRISLPVGRDVGGRVDCRSPLSNARVSDPFRPTRSASSRRGRRGKCDRKDERRVEQNRRRNGTSRRSLRWPGPARGARLGIGGRMRYRGETGLLSTRCAAVARSHLNSRDCVGAARSPVTRRRAKLAADLEGGNRRGRGVACRRVSASEQQRSDQCKLTPWMIRMRFPYKSRSWR